MADWKIKHFSRQESNSSTFQGLSEPWEVTRQDKRKHAHKQDLLTYESLPVYTKRPKEEFKGPSY